MTDQPPVQPPGPPSGPPAQGDPATQPMPASPTPSDAPPAASAPPTGTPATPPRVPRSGVWHQATSTRGGRTALAVAAGALAVLMMVGIGIAGFLVLGHHDRFAMAGHRETGQSRDQNDQGDGQPGRRLDRQDRQDRQDKGDRRLPQRGMPGAPGLRGGGEGLAGLGSVLAGTLHGNVTATVNGSVQALIVQRGQVTAVSATSITLKSSDGFVGTYVRNATTKANGVDPVKGGQALVVARASDRVALRTIAAPVGAGVAPSS